MLNFVLSTVDTLIALQKILHGENITLPVGVVGQVSTRIIRAYLEDVNNTSEEELTETQKILQYLYISENTIDYPARPIELIHPDVENSQLPHKYNYYPFFLTWHDFFHTWRSSSNFKVLIKKLIQIHDEKTTFNGKQNIMSKPIWNLADIDIDCDQKMRKNLFYQMNYILNVLIAGGFNFSNSQDDNCWLLYYICQFPDKFKEGFFEKNPAELVDWIRLHKNSFEESLQNDLLYFCNQVDEVTHFLIKHPQATVIDVILNDLLKPAEEGDEALLADLNVLDSKTIFYWSNNTKEEKYGINFKKEFNPFLNSLGVNEVLRMNTPDLIRSALKEIINKKQDKLQVPPFIFEKKALTSEEEIEHVKKYALSEELCLNILKDENNQDYAYLEAIIQKKISSKILAEIITNPKLEEFYSLNKSSIISVHFSKNTFIRLAIIQEDTKTLNILLKFSKGLSDEEKIKFFTESEKLLDNAKKDNLSCLMLAAYTNLELFKVICETFHHLSIEVKKAILCETTSTNNNILMWVLSPNIKETVSNKAEIIKILLELMKTLGITALNSMLQQVNKYNKNALIYAIDYPEEIFVQTLFSVINPQESPETLEIMLLQQNKNGLNALEMAIKNKYFNVALVICDQIKLLDDARVGEILEHVKPEKLIELIAYKQTSSVILSMISKNSKHQNVKEKAQNKLRIIEAPEELSKQVVLWSWEKLETFIKVLYQGKSADGTWIEQDPFVLNFLAFEFNENIQNAIEASLNINWMKTWCAWKEKNQQQDFLNILITYYQNKESTFNEIEKMTNNPFSKKISTIFIRNIIFTEWVNKANEMFEINNDQIQINSINTKVCNDLINFLKTYLSKSINKHASFFGESDLFMKLSIGSKLKECIEKIVESDFTAEKTFLFLQEALNTALVKLYDPYQKTKIKPGELSRLLLSFLSMVSIVNNHDNTCFYDPSWRVK